MKYVSELSMFSLLVLAVYAVLPSTVESRAVDAGNYISREADDAAVENKGYEWDEFVEGYLAGKRACSANDYVARAALKRSLKDEVRNEMAKRYSRPIDFSGGSLLSGSLQKGVGRR